MTHSQNMPQVAIDFMNEDHEMIYDLINKIKALTAQSNSDSNDTEVADQITQLMLSLVQACKDHFEREENLMQQYHFPYLAEHKDEHQLMIQVIDETFNAWQDKQDFKRLKQFMDLTLPTWFIGHVDTMDNMTALFIAGAEGDFSGDNLSINNPREEQLLNETFQNRAPSVKPDLLKVAKPKNDARRTKITTSFIE